MDDNYKAVDVYTLSNLLLNPKNADHVHRNALNELAKQTPLERRKRLHEVLRTITEYPTEYNQDVIELAIEILGTDPHADATEILIRLLPRVAARGTTGKNGLPTEVRDYFYRTLVAKNREEDIEVWADLLPTITADDLAAMLIDPAAEPIVEAIAPLTLINDLNEPTRTETLFKVMTGIIRVKGNTKTLQAVVVALRERSDPDMLQTGIEGLAALWERLRKAEAKSTLAVVEKILGVLDDQPRTTPERLMGKRPWAP